MDATLVMDKADIIAKANAAEGYLKAMSNETRLILLCHLVERSRTVGELEELTGLAQANVSQHLSRLRAYRLVQATRHGKSVTYSVADADAMEILQVLYRKFCVVG
jgi:DNA-binding transcriptional ArsR family regulator